MRASSSLANRRLAPLITALAAGSLLACHDATPPAPPPPRVARIDVIGPDTLVRGTQATLTAVLRDSTGAPLSPQPEASWLAEPTTTLRLVPGAPPGTVEGRGLGTAVVSAVAQGVTGSRTVHVVSPLARLVSFALTGPDSLEVGTAGFFWYEARDAVGNFLVAGENFRSDTSIGRLALTVTLSDTTILRPFGAAALASLGTLQGAVPGTLSLTVVANGLTAAKTVRVTASPPNAPPTLVAGGLTFAAVEAGEAFTCGPTPDGAVYCWGLNDVGQLGVAGSPVASLVPVRIALPVAATRLSVGRDHACVVGSDGAAYCWGSGAFGKRGGLTPAGLATGVDRLAIPEKVIAIAAGSLHTCAVVADGGVYCLGFDEEGQLGTPATTEAIGSPPYYARGTPGRMQTGVRLVSITAAESTNCGLAADGAAYCWGSTGIGTGAPLPEICRFFGRTGGGPNAVRSTPCTREPLPVAGGHRFVALDAGGLGTCGIRIDGAVLCWAGSAVPAVVPGISSARSVSVGTAHACAVAAVDVVLCWGANRFGQLGVAAPATSATPVAVPPPGSPAASVSAGGTHTCSLARSGAGACWGNPRNGRLGIGVFPPPAAATARR